MLSKKLGFVVLLCLLVGATAYANYIINKPKTEEAGIADGVQPAANSQELFSNVINQDNVTSDQSTEVIDEGAAYFEAFQADRDNVRAKEMDYLSNMASDASLDEKVKQQAQQQKLDLIDCMEKEVTIEGLIKSKGYANVAVTVHEGSVNIVIDKPSLESQEVAQILDIAHRETGEPGDNIKVMTK